MHPDVVIVLMALAAAAAGRWRAVKLGYPSISGRWSTLRSGTVDRVGTGE